MALYAKCFLFDSYTICLGKCQAVPVHWFLSRQGLTNRAPAGRMPPAPPHGARSQAAERKSGQHTNSC
ncbi:hypothetical protein NQZ68_030989 [Dissostichus eleginoides]|nr:hypothetical protein NQZ68_030989 [Dissostichus eleginoides]